LFEALARAILGRNQLLQLLIDNLQWCDRDTLEWLHYLLRFDRQARLLVLGTWRSEEADAGHPLRTLLTDLRHDEQLTEIILGPLDAAETATLAAQVAGRELDPAQATHLYRETEGNPLFVVETVRAELSGGRQRPAANDQEGTRVIPALAPKVQAVIAARLAQLSPPARELASVAAVIGRAFTVDVLTKASNASEEVLVHGLDELWQRRIVREQGANAYDFSHDKLREVAYASLSATRRRLLHRRVAEALEAVYASDLDSVSAQMAAHYEQAGLPQQAIAHYCRAAEAARRMYANDKAIAFLTRALELTPPTAHAERYDLLLAREPIYDLQGMREPQLRDIAELQALAQVLKDGQRQAKVFLRRARYAEAVSDYVAAIEAAQAAIRLSQATRDAHCEAAGYLQWGQVLWQQGDYDSARERLERAIELAQVAHAPDVEANSLRNLAAVAEYQGNHIGARDRIGEALRLYRELGDRLGEFRALNNLGVASTCLGDCANAQSSFEQALRLCREIGARQSESIVLRNLGGLADYQGDYATAQTCYEQSLQLCRATGERRGESETLTYLGLLFHHLGDYQTACEHSRRAAHIAQQVGAKYELGLALTHLGHALLSLGQLDQAADAYGQAIAIRRALGDLNLVMESLAGLARVAMAEGDLTQAQAHVTEILNHLQIGTLDGADEPLQVYWTCYRVLCANHDPRAPDILHTAHTRLQERAARIGDEEMRHSFLENVSAHREIVEAWARRQTTQLPG
jgi:tetratricopeptide (TPR) repeat protein